MPKLIDLSMRVHNDMVSFPRVVRPALVMYEDVAGSSPSESAPPSMASTG